MFTGFDWVQISVIVEDKHNIKILDVIIRSHSIASEIKMLWTYDYIW